MVSKLLRQLLPLSAFCLLLGIAAPNSAKDLAITMDDPNLAEAPRMNAKERDQKIREALKEHKIKAALFVCGMRVDSAAGKELLAAWDREHHLLANHSYSHFNLNSAKTSLSDYIGDFRRNEKLLVSFQSFDRIFRFPYLKEGETADKRDGFRRELAENNYRSGGVTIDASDWYISDRMVARLGQNPNADLSLYRDYYLAHIWNRMQYYDSLATKVTGRQIQHTLLVHHNLLNALFLKDLLAMVKSKGWKLIDAKNAFTDPIFKEQPAILPAGESCVRALAEASGKFREQLRYPGEDGEYEKAAMDKLGL